MTNERKIEILEIAKKDRGLNCATNGICTAIMRAMSKRSIEDTLESFPELLKYKPFGYDVFQLWLPLVEENIPKRIAIIDEMISELKQQNL